MSRYLDLIKERPLVLDGAMGTMLYQQGVFVNACYEELSITRPALVSAIHAEYADAGADVLLTNTFGANRIKLGEFGLAGDAVRINSAAVEIARKAAGESVLVAGDVGPCEARGNAMSDPHAVEAAFAEQMSALASAGADLIFLETFSNPEELKIAARCAASTGIPVHASVAVDEDGVSAQIKLF